MSEKSFLEILEQHKDEYSISYFNKNDNVEAILEKICAYLNSNGGWIIVKNSMFANYEIESFKDKLQDKINNDIFPIPLVYVTKEKDDSGDSVLINVLQGAQKPYSYLNNYYILNGKKSEIANSDELSLLLRISKPLESTWENLNTIDATFKDLDKNEIQKTIDSAELIRKSVKVRKKPEDFLNSFKLFDLYSVKNGAVVLFGIDPAKFLPQCRIRITVMPFGKTGSQTDDTTLIEDNLFKSFNKLEKYFKETMPVISSHSSWERESREKYPSEALDEAIVNAMVHREYSDISGEITINIYQDKLEIINSGEIPSGIISNNKVNIHHSILRNPSIAHMFFLRGKMEKLGRGLTLIVEKFKEYGLRKPEWISENGYTKLTLYSTSDDILNERMISFLESLSPNRKFTREDYEKHFKIASRTARNDIKDMLYAKYITKKGKGPKTHYFKTSKSLPKF